jgi:hypothetical protein
MDLPGETPLTKAIAVVPGKPNSVHLATLAKPSLSDVANGRSVNASRDNVENGVRDRSQAEAEYPGWLRRLLTHPVRGLANYRELFERLQNPNGAIKIFCEVE